MAIIKPVEQLILLGALTKDCNLLNPVGNHMARLPLDPMHSKALILASEFNCLEEMLITVAMLSVESIFFIPRGKKEESNIAKRQFSSPESDHITLINVYRASKEFLDKTTNDNNKEKALKNLRKWCKENFINRSLRDAHGIHSKICGNAEQNGLRVASCGDDMTQFRRCLAASFLNAALVENDSGDRYRCYYICFVNMATSPSPTCTKTKKGDEPCDDHDESNGGEGFDHLLLQKLDLGPRKKLLVLDLNGLLIRRAHRCDKLQMQSNRQPDIEIGYRLVFKRPFCEEFIQFCLERFEVGIWSTAQEHNTDGVFNCAFKGLKSKLLFVWDQRQCSDYGFMSLENKEKPLFFKELKKVWEKVGSSVGKRGSYSAVDTLLIDNSPYRGFLNPPNTGIYPDPYDPSCLTDNALDPSKELGQYLNGLVDADDVQTYVKDHPFGQPAIGPDHPDWRFYSKIRHSLGFDKPSTREVDTI